jgi:nickel-dependent lactate racemase
VSSPSDTVLSSVASPVGTPPLAEVVKKRKPGEVVVVVSDITRPIPYAEFLPKLLTALEDLGVARDEVLLLVATGMHRPSTPLERLHMFGREVVDHYRIVDHCADDESELRPLGKSSWSGAKVRLNRHYIDAGLRMVTGLVESHFMAGFSGGRKTICPGLASLDTVRNFHGYTFLSDPKASNANLDGNPLHDESLSVARLAPPDFSVNVVLNRHRQMVTAFSGGLEEAHAAACNFVRSAACPPVAREADLAVTSCGGYPLDSTFYQCVKGFVSCLPAVRKGGAIVAVGSCTEGVGGPEYASLMERYSGSWRTFLTDIRQDGFFTKDQWQLQMHIRALERVGEENVFLASEGLDGASLERLSVTGIDIGEGTIERAVQARIDRLVRVGRTVAAFPEGPYCAPLASDANDPSTGQ